MPYQPAVTPDTRPLYEGLSALGEGFAQRNDNIRKEREKNEAADVTLEHLHASSPDLLEPFLRRGGDTQTPSAELLGKFLGGSTRTKKEALIGAAAGKALMDQRKLEQGLDVTRVGNEGARIAQQGQQNTVQNQQWEAEQRRLKTATAMEHSRRNADRKAQGKVDIVELPNGGGQMVVNGSGNFSRIPEAQPATTPPPPWAAQAMAADSTLYWSGDSLKSKPADPMAAYRGPTGAPPVQPGAAPQAALPPLPQMHKTPADVRNDGALSRDQKVQILRTQFGLR